MFFSIIVVCLNAGEKLRDTVRSILSQTEQDYEIIIKDGISSDEVTSQYLREYSGLSGCKTSESGEPAGRIRVYRSKDTGIYDAMNQAVQYARGEYIFFLNCGDGFYDGRVLGKVRQQIEGQSGGIGRAEEKGKHGYIFYGNIYERQTGTLIQSNPVIDDFACYRNLPCHQACFYSVELFRHRAFDTGYTVRADYEHFLWCYYRAHARTVYMPVTVALYEGGGFSETKENEKKSKEEHLRVVNQYMPKHKIVMYRLIMLMTLAPLRTWIAKNPVTAGMYQAVKRKMYKR